MSWTDRQRAMLRAIGLAVWSPPAVEAAPDVPRQEVVTAEPPVRPCHRERARLP